MKEFLRKFGNPGVEYRGLPFWAWNGELDREEIKRQVNVFKDMGFGGFFIHSRIGVITEYLGDEWFECIDVAVKEAEKLGLRVYLYDEDRWPSGTCGGMVTIEPQFRQKSLAVKIVDANKFSFEDYRQEFVRAFAVKFEGHILIDYVPYDIPQEISKNYSIAVVYIVEMEPQDFYNGYTYLDTLNRDATDCFIKLTHEKYKERFGSLFGNGILGFFTDEIHHGALFSGFNLTNKERMSMCPWTYNLFKTFKRKFDYNLEDRLPEIFFKGKEVFSKTSYDYNEIVEEMFIENFVKPYSEWCKENNLILTGHILHEDCLGAQASCCGSAARLYEYFQIPGIDVLTEYNMNYWVAKQCVSVARQFGNKWALSELYGATGWDFTFEGHRNVGAWQAVQGINVRCHHLSWYTMKGEAKRDYPASIFYQSAWANDYKFIEDMFARLACITADCQAICDIGVLSPVESLWGLSHIGWINVFYPTEKEGIYLEKTYEETYRCLVDKGIDFDYIDEDILSRNFKVEEKLLRVCKAQYGKVIVRGLLNIRSSTLKILEEFEKNGGKVYWVGDLPRYVDGERKQINPFGEYFPEIDNELLFALKESPVSVESNTPIIKSVYRKGDDIFAIILNQDREYKVSNVVITANDKCRVEEWDIVTGKIAYVAAENTDKGLTCNISLEAGEIKVYRFFDGKTESLSSCKRKLESVFVPSEFEYQLHEDNICVLDIVRCVYLGKEYSRNEVLKIETEIRKNHGMCPKNGNMIQPWFLSKFRGEETKEEALYLEFCFDVLTVPTKVDFITEEVDADIYFNGKKLEKELKKELWVDNCFGVFSVDPSYLKLGKNIIELYYGYSERKNIEAVYLKGDFGVKVNGDNVSLIMLPKKLRIGDICEQGLPFYSAKLTYKIPLEEGNYNVTLPKTYASINYVRGRGDCCPVAFIPYSANVSVDNHLYIDCVFTRRNTFGPLHYYPKHRGTCSSDNYYSTGSSFTLEYQVIEQGLLSEPKIEKVIKNDR